MALSKADYTNILAVIDFGFQKGIVKNQDHAKVLLFLEEKIKNLLSLEVEDGDNSPSGPE